jgi:hypothetical protein
VHVDQHQGHSLALGQLPEGLLDVKPDVDAVMVVLDVGHVALVGVGKSDAWFGASQPVQA